VRNVLVFAVLAALAWFGYTKYQAQGGLYARAGFTATAPSQAPSQPDRFSCDGRTRCTQMTSCEEATYFIQHCPNTTMDGDHDGLPCEQQWCQ
jgi:hypothetical protein